jgi:hypothetical protein
VPTFGDGNSYHSIFLYNNCNTDRNNYSYAGIAYEDAPNGQDMKTFLSG